MHFTMQSTSTPLTQETTSLGCIYPPSDYSFNIFYHYNAKRTLHNIPATTYSELVSSLQKIVVNLLIH